MSDELKDKIKWSCKFNNLSYEIIEGYLRIVEHTNSFLSESVSIWYLSSNLNVDTINNKNEVIKNEIEKLNKKKEFLDLNDDFKEYTLELLSKLNCKLKNNEVIFPKSLCLFFIFDSLNRKTKKELIAKLIASLDWDYKYQIYWWIYI